MGSLRSSTALALALPVFGFAVLGCTATVIESPAALDWLPGGTAGRVVPPTSAGPLPIDLAGILQLGGERALAIEAAKARAAAAAADQDLANSRWWPSLRPRVSFVHHEDRLQSTVGTFSDVHKQNTTGGIGADIGLNLVDAWMGSVVADQRMRAAGHALRAAQHMSTAKAVGLYYDLLEAVASRQVAERTMAHATELVKVQEAGERGGSVLPADVLRAKAFLASARGEVAYAQSRVTGANARLAALLMLPPGTELVVTAEVVKPIDFGEAVRPVAELARRAVLARPEIQQAKANLAAADAERSRRDWSWVLPELRVGAERSTFGATLGSGQGREDLYADLVWEWGFGGVARARRADAEHRLARVSLRGISRDLHSDITVAVSEVRSNKARMAAAHDELAAASAALALVTARQRQGKLRLLEQLDAERADSAARIHLIQAVVAHNRAQFELHRLLGGR